MASSEIAEIREILTTMSNDGGNTQYYIKRIREKLATLDPYVSSLEDTVNALSTRIVLSR